ncbi:MAG TPA: toast rack family protein [Bacillota bacterium]|nr:toast rack family protein [Bacillota bacterium]
MNLSRLTRYLIISLIILVLFTGCDLELSNGKAGRTEALSKSIALGEAKSVDTKIQIGIGEFSLTGGCDELFAGEFLYNIPEWKPEVEYTDSSDQGRLSIRQPDSKKVNMDKSVYRWTLDLNSDLPTNLDVDLGVGTGNLDLRGVNLKGLSIDCGVGEVLIDLSGNWETGFRGSINSGVGEVTIYLPKDVGVKVNATSGIGGIKAEGMTKKSGSYYNDAAEISDILVELDIEGGIGQINLGVK